MVEIQYKRAQVLLTERRNELELLAQALLEKEVLLKSDVERLIGPRPFTNFYEDLDAKAIAQNGVAAANGTAPTNADDYLAEDEKPTEDIDS